MLPTLAVVGGVVDEGAEEAAGRRDVELHVHGRVVQPLREVKLQRVLPPARGAEADTGGGSSGVRQTQGENQQKQTQGETQKTQTQREKQQSQTQGDNL